MPLTPLDALTVIPHVVRVISRLARALRKRSAGGKRITPEERAGIVAELRDLATAVERAVVD